MNAGPIAAASSSRRATALCCRSPASLAQALATVSTSAAWFARSGRASVSGGTGRVACIIRSPRASSALNGWDPASVRHAMRPTAYTSARASTAVPSACSGARYSGVPTTIPAWVALAPAGSAIFAIPKSRIFVTSRPEGDRARNTFSGFRSRCTTPRAWATSSPAQICQRIGTACSGGRNPSRRSRSKRLSPVSSSITRNR